MEVVINNLSPLKGAVTALLYHQDLSLQYNRRIGMQGASRKASTTNRHDLDREIKDLELKVASKIVPSTAKVCKGQE
jgi:hypothetical protein